MESSQFCPATHGIIMATLQSAMHSYHSLSRQLHLIRAKMEAAPSLLRPPPAHQQCVDDQVVLPVQYDNPLWAAAVEELQIGTTVDIRTVETNTDPLCCADVGTLSKALRCAFGSTEKVAFYSCS